MATMSGDGANGGIPGGEMPQGNAPMFTVLVQYTKDFSFENPNAPISLRQQPAGQQEAQIRISPPAVERRQLSATEHEVQLKLDGRAVAGNNVLFAFDLNYAGVFHVQNIPPENLEPLLMIEGARLLFPYAREIISSAVASGGFQPFLLPPVDFVGLYQQKVAEAQALQQPAAQA